MPFTIKPLLDDGTYMGGHTNSIILQFWSHCRHVHINYRHSIIVNIWNFICYTMSIWDKHLISLFHHNKQRKNWVAEFRKCEVMELYLHTSGSTERCWLLISKPYLLNSRNPEICNCAIFFGFPDLRSYGVRASANLWQWVM